MMSELGQKRQQHAANGRQGISHLRPLLLPLIYRISLRIAIEAMIMAV